MHKQSTNKQYMLVDLGPSTIIMLAELILITLKLMNQISYSWTLVLSPIILVILGASIILFFTLIEVIKDNLF